jgi:hypothetical protein
MDDSLPKYPRSSEKEIKYRTLGIVTELRFIRQRVVIFATFKQRAYGMLVIVDEEGYRCM